MIVLGSNNKSNREFNINNFFIYIIYIICFISIWNGLFKVTPEGSAEESPSIDMSYYGISDIGEISFQGTKEDVTMRVGHYSTVYTSDGSLVYDVTFKINELFGKSVLDDTFNEFTLRLPEKAISEEQLNDRSIEYEGTINIVYLEPNFDELQNTSSISEETFVDDAVLKGKWLSSISSIEFMYSDYIGDGVYSVESSEQEIIDYIQSLNKTTDKK